MGRLVRRNDSKCDAHINLQLPIFPLPEAHLVTLLDEAVSFVRQNIPPGITVGFSGGKDSICTAKVIEVSGLDYQLEYSFTGIEPPEVVRFIRKHYPHCSIRVPKRTFWKDLAVHVPPSDRLRWCCTLLKKTNADIVLGVRAEESSRRASRNRVNVYHGRTMYYPILHWKEWEVWEVIRSLGLPYPGLYDEGFDRIGCVICPYHSEGTGKLHQLYRDRWPHIFRRWDRAIVKLYNKRVSQGKKMY